ncbi:membrane-spanning 4-domains subfamily A member 8 [Microtus pennsylvanicus]|uniref:membrane-spanning 4-domains subfamily A member 8 n=1 Tax=Microtus pennsylvanicus TaxID=10058 RepID=UPI003F6A9043
MNPTTPPGPTANSVYMVPPYNGYPVITGTVAQVPLYPGNQTQIHVIHGNPPGSVPVQKVLKDGKVLGAIQILIGLVHIGLGSIMFFNLFGYYVPVSLYGGFPFWGGIWFIISGSFSVVAEKQPNSPCLMNASVALNIFSAISSAVGVMLFITDMCVAGTSGYHYYDSRNIGMAISGVLLIFCLLELCIASVSSHFGCQVTCCRHNNVDVVIPNVYATNPVVIPEPPNPIPSYSSVVQDSR